jgi:hypothetical protein
METIKSKTVAVVLGDGQNVSVKRMKWKAARDFLKKLSALAIAIAPKLKEAKAAPFDFVAMLPQVMNHGEDLINHVLRHSTSLTVEQVDELEVDDVLKVLGAAFLLNYDEELKNFFAGIGRNLEAQPSAPELAADQATTS